MAWASVTPGPFDWDVSYYLGVAQRIAAHPLAPATTDAVWNLGWLPPMLTHPADLHWMPLPSRVVVPALWIGGVVGATPWHAAQGMTAALAAVVAVLATVAAARVGAARGVCIIAGLVAGSGLGYVRYFSIPDSMALYAVAAGVAWLAAGGLGWTRGRALACAAACMMAALTRAEGALVGVAVVFASGVHPKQSRVGRMVAGACGPIAAMAWAARCELLVGEGYSALRAHILDATGAEGWLSPGTLPSLGLASRVDLLVAHAADLGKTPIAAGAILLPVALGGLLLVARPSLTGTGRFAAAPAVYAMLAPVVLYLGAPSAAIEGSVFRSLAALMSPAVAVMVVGLSRASTRFHPVFFPALYGAAQIALVTAIGMKSQQFSTPFPDCAALDAAGVPAGAPILSYDPLGTSTRCGHPGVVLGRATTEPQVDDLADRYSTTWALTAPADYRSWTRRADDADLAGWTQVAGGRVYRRAK